MFHPYLLHSGFPSKSINLSLFIKEGDKLQKGNLN